VVEAITSSVTQLNRDRRAIPLSIGTTGPADATSRIARIAHNLPDWREIPVADWLESTTGLPTSLTNDANCAGLGEAWLAERARSPTL
jgi:glucokinase